MKFKRTLCQFSLNFSYPRPDINSLCVSHWRQRIVNGRGLRGHGEQSGDPKGDPGGHGVGVEPEADPRHDDQHATRHVDCQQVIRELAFERQVHRQAAVFACKEQIKV